MLAAAPTSTDLQIRVSEATGVPVIQGYGMTELSPASHVDYTDGRNRTGSVGQLTPDTQEKMVDVETEGTEVTPCETGELLVREPQVMKGYFNNPSPRLKPSPLMDGYTPGISFAPMKTAISGYWTARKN